MSWLLFVQLWVCNLFSTTWQESGEFDETDEESEFDE